MIDAAGNFLVNGDGTVMDTHKQIREHISALSDGELSAVARHLVATNRTPGEEVAVIAFATPGVPGEGRPTVGMHTVALTPQRYAHFAAPGRHALPSRRRTTGNGYCDRASPWFP